MDGEENFHCWCSAKKKFKSLHGLKLHQRIHRVGQNDVQDMQTTFNYFLGLPNLQEKKPEILLPLFPTKPGFPSLDNIPLIHNSVSKQTFNYLLGSPNLQETKPTILLRLFPENPGFPSTFEIPLNQSSVTEELDVELRLNSQFSR